MSKLEELYREREQLNARIAEAELCQHLEAMLAVVEQAAWKALPEEALTGRVVAALEYIDGKLTRIGATRKADVLEQCEVVRGVSIAEEQVVEQVEEPEGEENEQERRARSRSIGFTVHFGDGKVVSEKTAKQTWIQALRYMGLERVSRYEGAVVGFPMVGKIKRDNSQKSRGELQTLVDGWWIYTCLNNEQKIEHLKRIAAFLRIPLEIRRHDQAE
ncbi:MAG: hypothetical protein ACI4AM_07015 [Muribaculaceae bacterium]